MTVEIKCFLRVTLIFDHPVAAPVIFKQVALTADGERFCAATEGNVYMGKTSISSSNDKFTALHKLDSSCGALTFVQYVSGLLGVFAGSKTGSLTAIDTGSRQVVGYHSGIGEAVCYISVHPSADRIVTSHKHLAVVWNIANEIIPLQSLKTSDSSADLLRADFDKAGNSVITTFMDGRIYMWDFPTLEFSRQLLGSEIPLKAVSFSGSGQYLACVGSLPVLFLSDIKSVGQPRVITLPEECGNLIEIAFLLSDSSEMVFVFLTESGHFIFYDCMKNCKLRVVRKSKNGQKGYVNFAVTSYRKTCKWNRFLIIAVDESGNLDLLTFKVFSTSTRDTIYGAISRDTNQQNSTDISGTAVKKSIESVVKHDGVDLDVSSQSAVLNPDQLKAFLQRFGEFPSKYRFTLWRHLLKLPLNKDAFETLVRRGIHPAYQKLEQKFDLVNEKLIFALKRMLSALAYWCSLFAEVTFLPLFVFPFVKVLYQDLMLCFEIILCYLVNWAFDWFEYYPAPPFHVLAIIEMFIASSCPALLDHFKEKGVTVQVYAWPLIKSSLSEIFTEDEWLRVWDHIITSRKPQMLLSVVAAYAIISYNTLIQCHNLTDFQKYFRDKNPISLKVLIEKAVQLVEENDLSSRKSHSFRFLPSGTYPVFYNFPHAAVEIHAHEMNKLRQLEEECLKQKKATLAAEAKYGTVYEQEEVLRWREAVLKSAAFLRRQELFEEERRLTEQRTRFQVVNEKLQERELAILEANRKRIIREQLLRKEEEISKLDDELRWRARLRDAEMWDAVNGAQWRNHHILVESCNADADRLQNLLTRDGAKHLPEYVPLVRPRENMDLKLGTSDDISIGSVQNNVDKIMQQLSILEKRNRHMEMDVEDMVRQVQDSN